MMYDDDDLDRALAALPLEEPPARLHARILAATVDAPPVAAPFHPWELWLVGVLAALAVWLSWLVVAEPHLAQRFSDALATSIATVAASSQTWLWVAIGALAAAAISATSAPLAPRRIERR
jgi:Na+/proline symporter